MERIQSASVRMQFRWWQESSKAVQWWQLCNEFLSPTRMRPRRALVRATQRRRESRRKPSSFISFDRTAEKITMSVSWPWKESTVPTRTLSDRNILRLDNKSSLRISCTCLAYGLITAILDSCTSPKRISRETIPTTIWASRGLERPPKLWFTSASRLPTCRNARGCWLGHGKPWGEGESALAMAEAAQRTKPL